MSHYAYPWTKHSSFSSFSICFHLIVFSHFWVAEKYDLLVCIEICELLNVIYVPKKLELNNLCCLSACQYFFEHPKMIWIALKSGCLLIYDGRNIEHPKNIDSCIWCKVFRSTCFVLSDFVEVLDLYLANQSTWIGLKFREIFTEIDSINFLFLVS